MSNPMNHGTVIGRVANDPRSFQNSDGSKKVMVTVYADRNFKGRDGKRASDAIDLEAFVRAETAGLGPFDNVGKGDLVALNFTLRHDVFERGGQTVHETKVVAEDVTYLEPRSVTQARRAERAKAQSDQNEAAQTGVTAAPAAAGSVITEDAPY